MAKTESDRLAETTPIYAEMRKENKWEIPRIKLPEEFSGNAIYTPANGYPEDW